METLYLKFTLAIIHPPFKVPNLVIFSIFTDCITTIKFQNTFITQKETPYPLTAIFQSHLPQYLEMRCDNLQAEFVI